VRNSRAFCSAPDSNRRVKVDHTRLSSVGFRSWSKFLAVSLEVMWVVNPAVACHYFPPGLQLPPQPLRGLLPILLLGEQRHDGCEQFAYDCYRTASRLRFEPGPPSAPESSTLTTRLPSHPPIVERGVMWRACLSPCVVVCPRTYKNRLNPETNQCSPRNVPLAQCSVRAVGNMAWRIMWHIWCDKPNRPSLSQRTIIEHSNSGKKVSIRFDSRYRIDFFYSNRFGNLINLPLVHWYSNSKLGVIFYSMHCVTAFVDVLHSIAFNCVDYGVI